MKININHSQPSEAVSGFGFCCGSYPVGMRGQYTERIATVHRWMDQRRCTYRAKDTQEMHFVPLL